MRRREFLRILLILTVGIIPVTELHAARGVRIEERREAFISGGKKISVETFAPAGRGRLPAVLVLHSSVGTLIGKGELERFSRAVAAQGKVAFLVRYFDRTGTIFAGSGTIDKCTDAWLETVRHTVDFAAVHPQVRADSIGMFGYSLGAYLAVAEASRDPRIDVVMEIAGGRSCGI